MANRAMSAAAPAPHLAISIASHQTLALDRVVAAITPRRPSDPTATASALAAAGQVATLVDVLSHAFPLKRVDRWPDDRRCAPGLARLIARALVEHARAADLFPLLSPERLDAMDAQMAPGRLPSYVWSIPFSGAYRYAVYRQGGAGPLERVLYTLATAPYVGVAEASADLNVAPSGPDDPLLPLLHLLIRGHAAVARAVESLHSATAARLFTWLGDPCPSITALLAYMVGETGDEFLDWDEDSWHGASLYGEDNAYAWDEEIVDLYAAHWRHTRAHLDELEHLWTALDDPSQAPRLARAIYQVTQATSLPPMGGGML